MKINVKNVVEVAGGLVLGILASETVKGIGKLAKGAIIKIKEKAPKNS